MQTPRDALALGVEEEYQLIAPDTRALLSSSDHVVPEAGKVLGRHVHPEIHRSQVEGITRVCSTLSDVRSELLRLRRDIGAAARVHGATIAAAASHPFSRWEDQEITPEDRYWGIEHQYQQLAREQMVFGYHVHVDLTDPAMAIGIMNRTRLWLSPLIALSASSPYWMGVDTGYASYRTMTYSRFPFTGPPGVFASREEHDTLIAALVESGSIEDITKIYWDIRLPERVPTIEFRVADMCQTVDEAVMIAGLVRALVRTCHDEAQSDQPFPRVRHELVRAANWRAARYGLDHTLIDVTAGCSVPARTLIEMLLGYLRASLEEVGDWEEVSTLVYDTLERGNGATRQREAYQRTRNLRDVVDLVLEETAAGQTG